MTRDELGRQAPHVPTDELRAKVLALALKSVPQKDIAKVIGIASDDTLREHYREELDEAYLIDYQRTVGALDDLIEGGNVNAVKFKLERRYGSKGWGPPTAKVETTGETTIKVVHERRELPKPKDGWCSPIPEQED